MDITNSYYNNGNSNNSSNNYNQKRSQKSNTNKHSAAQRQQQQFTSVTGALSGTSTAAATAAASSSSSSSSNISSYFLANESGFKKKYKYNNQFGNNNTNNINNYLNNNINNVNTNNGNHSNNLSSKSLRLNSTYENNHFSNYNRNRRSYNKYRYYSTNSYQNDHNLNNYHKQFSANTNNKQFNNNNFRYHHADNNFQYFNFGKYQSSFIQLAATPPTSCLLAATSTDSSCSNSSTLSTLNVPYDYAQLPNVVLAKIYSYLPLKDRLSASISCKNWRSGLLNNPCLWTSFDLVIYLCNKQFDFKSAHFKLKHFGKLSKNCVFKFDSDDLILIEKLASSIELIKNESNNLKCLTLGPIFNLDTKEDAQNSSRNNNNNNNNNNNIDYFELEKKEKLKLRLFKSITDLISCSKSIEHLSLGFLNDIARSSENLLELINQLDKKQKHYLKSLHISSIKKSSVFYLSRFNSVSLVNKNANLIQPTISNLVEKFSNLKYLSIDFDDLTDDLIQSEMFSTSLKKLNLNVNNLNNTNETKNMQRNQVWLNVVSKNSNLRVAINVLVQEDFARKYNSVLSSNIPLETLRMFFCKSFNPEIIQFLSDNYSHTLQSLSITDSIVEPTLRYHNPLRFDADPDPLILLCWKCKNLQELVVVGYEMLEINLIAIAKLRSNLKKFHVAMDCIIDLKYGKFRNDDFIEDEEGEDTIVDYGFCSDQVIDKVCKILGSQNWHPLEKEELPLSVYDFDVPFEEAYLETLSREQIYNFD